MGKELATGSRLTGTPRQVTADKMIAFERVIWHRVANVHSDPAVANKVGMAKPIASGQNQLAFLHELMERNFADGWIKGGKISARWVCPVYADDLITPFGEIKAVDVENGRARAKLEVWCMNQRGEKTAAGTAEAYLG